ncbi:DUF317 domain-containing protein [Streptomyces noursei]|uniref:DUF317 domain-containing protein n=1 Tax=Streptomyces noursei TaxID=1971 RepID=UPI0035E22059
MPPRHRPGRHALRNTDRGHTAPAPDSANSLYPVPARTTAHREGKPTVNRHTAPSPVLIAPRYLAGPDATATSALIQQLQDDQWRRESFSDCLVFSRREPGGLLEALHTPAGVQRAPKKGRESSWEFTARPGPGEAATWSVRFAPKTPPELPAALAAALTDTDRVADGQHSPHYLRPVGRPDEATAPLSAAGWIHVLTRYEYAWYAPDERALVVTGTSDEHGHGVANWLFAASRATDNITLWHATAHPRTPTHLIHALCTAITDPSPVLRTRPPSHETGPVTTARP